MTSGSPRPPKLLPAEVEAIEPDYARKTWRYLRLAMVALVLGLAVSLVFERAKVDCFQTSISAYYYTPVHSYFVGALIGVAVCLVCLRGNTGAEDVLLNLAGMFAPVVAFVPTPAPGSCASVLESTRAIDNNVANNMTALIVLGGGALIAAGIFTWRNGPTRPGRISYIAAVANWLVTTLVFFVARDFFIDNAHYVAAILMFGCICSVAVVNAFDYKRKRPGKSLANRYIAIAIAMVVLSAIIGLAGALGWDYYLLALEITLITLFACFWLMQTVELWGVGLRTEPLADGDRTRPGDG
jgi:hypothetical protein